jgi:hypothetical protein
MSTPSKKSDEFVRIDLTPTQQQEVEQKTGKPAEAIELTVDELEDRIAPRGGFESELMD